MTSVDSSHADKTRHSSSKHPAPKVEVHRSVSRETITIHFSAAGKEEEEEEEEEEEFKEPLEEFDDQSIVTGEEAMEELYFDPGTQTDSCPAKIESTSLSPSQIMTTVDTVQAVDSLASKTDSTLPIPLSSSSSILCPEPNETNIASSTKQGNSVSLSLSRVPALSRSTPVPPISSSKPFMSLVKSLSTEGEPKEPTTTIRHRHLMKTLVKSLSTDTSKQDSESFKGIDSKLNLHLFKQFTQPRITGGDSKTAPSSPITSPSDGRSFFKVTEMEAKIEDTKRRLSEVMYEPFQLLSKMIGEEPLNYRPKALSSSASELSNLSSLNGHLESNNYSIKEEEGDLEADYSTIEDIALKDKQPKTSSEHTKASSALALEKCSLSALASKEDEEFTELYSEDFDFEEEAEDRLGDVSEAEEGSGTHSLEEELLYEECSDIPVKTLYFFVLAVYGYQTLPLPSYLDGLFLGVALGFMAAICVIWLFSSTNSRQHKVLSHQQPLKVEPLQISEPDIMKGWMNEIQNYDPETYHATLTHSIFVRLEGSTLRLSKPNKNVSRRAIYNEAKLDVVYISQKIYDLVDSKVYLVPKSLARKRVWNKKYPICLELARQDDFMSKAQADREAAEDKVDKGEQTEDGSRAVPTQDSSKAPGHLEQVLYLFGRTGREKEEWFRKFLLASKMKSDGKKASNPTGIKPGHLLTHSRNSSRGSMDEVLAQSKPKEISGNVRQKSLLDYNVYMARCIPQEECMPDESPAHSANSSPTATKKVPGEHLAGAEEMQAWVNALLGRMFWDFLGEKYWSDLVSKKIQMKLSKIKLPYFMNELTLTELDMGVSVPKILRAFEPTIDHRGLWTDLEISYNGSFLMTLETKMNLTKLGKEPLGEALKVGEIGKEGARPRAYYLADSDEESSSAGSSDEDDGTEITGDKQLTPGSEGYSGVHRTSKIMRFVDKITKSKYFQKATETEFIKKKIEEVSNTPLLLTVEVQECQGTLTINIPPPPTDRIWYGFRKPPHLELKARPKLGEREVTLAHVTDWIERKLEHEFQKIFVMPNMDDLYLPIMHSAMDPRSSKEADLEAIDIP